MAKQGPRVKSCIAPLYLFICSERFARCHRPDRYSRSTIELIVLPDLLTPPYSYHQLARVRHLSLHVLPFLEHLKCGQVLPHRYCLSATLWVIYLTGEQLSWPLTCLLLGLASTPTTVDGSFWRVKYGIGSS